MTTVTEFSVTSHVWAVDRSTFVKRAGYFLCFVLERDDFGGFGLLLPFGTPDAPGNVAACCATNAEFRRGFRVDVPACVCDCAIEWITTGEHCGKIERNVWINYCSFWWQSESGPLTVVVVALNAQKCAETNHAFYLHAMQMWQTVSLLIFPVGILCDQHVNELSA